MEISLLKIVNMVASAGFHFCRRHGEKKGTGHAGTLFEMFD